MLVIYMHTEKKASASYLYANPNPNPNQLGYHLIFRIFGANPNHGFYQNSCELQRL